MYIRSSSAGHPGWLGTLHFFLDNSLEITPFFMLHLSFQAYLAFMTNTVDICTCRLPHHTCYTSKTLRLPSPYFQDLPNTLFPSILISPVPIRSSHDLRTTKYSFGLNFTFSKSSTNINPFKNTKTYGVQ